MTNRLLFILLFVISYLLSVNTPIIAQEITPTVTPSLEKSTAKSQKNFLEEFIDSLTEKKIPESVSRINKTQLPRGVDIKGKETENINKNKNVDTLDTKEKMDSSSIIETAAQYTAANALGQPNKGVSSNVVDFFKNIFGGILDIFGVIKKGDDEAKGVIDAKTPLLPTSIEGFGEKKQGKAMEEGVSKLKCLYLPMGMCKEESTSE